MVGQQPNCLVLQGIAPTLSAPPDTKAILNFTFGHWGVSPNLETELLHLVDNSPGHPATLRELSPLIVVHDSQF